MNERKRIPYKKFLRKYARQQRNNSSLCEILLWSEIKGRKFGVQFNRQVPLSHYIVDFYCFELLLAIEVDGSSHDSDDAIEYDNIRQNNLEEHGVTFLRFSNEEVLRDINNVLREIEGRVSELVKKYNITPGRNYRSEKRKQGNPVKKNDQLGVFKKDHPYDPLKGINTAVQEHDKNANRSGL